MRLLITTQSLDKNDPVLAFFHRWVEEFARHAERVTVICLTEGTHSLPPNVRVLTLGKEARASRAQYLSRLFTYAWRERNNYDTVFVHMNPEYLVLLGWFWRLTGKTTALWYTHREVNIKLRVATFFANVVFSASPYSFRITTTKARFVGHGVELTEWTPNALVLRDDANPTIITVGRITPIKNCGTFVEAARILREKGIPAQFVLVGGAHTETDKAYEKEIRVQIERSGLSGNVVITGMVSPTKVKEWYQKASLAVNLTPPGGLDKVVIEAAAAGVPTITSNIAFTEYFKEFADNLVFPLNDAPVLSAKIESFLKNPDRRSIRAYLCQMAQQEFSVEGVVGKIIEGIESN